MISQHSKSLQTGENVTTDSYSKARGDYNITFEFSHSFIRVIFKNVH